MGTVIIIALVVGVVLGIILAIARSQEIKTAAPGTIKIETVKDGWQVKPTIQKYAENGWTLDGTSASKSFGSHRRVTLTFRKT